MKKPPRTLLALLFALFGVWCTGRSPVGIAYHDADRLYDTLPALFYDDSNYTPHGRLQWNTARYRHKIEQTAALIDSMALPLIALWGVENEDVVRDLAASCRGDYCYLHRTLNTLDGLDFALLYYGDLFYPTYDRTARNALYIEGELNGRTIGILLSREERATRWIVEELREERPHAKLVVVTPLASSLPHDWALREVTRPAERAGRGTIRRGNRWVMHPKILVDTALRSSRGEVFARHYLIDASDGNPRPTYNRTRYCGGHGHALPLFVYVE